MKLAYPTFIKRDGKDYLVYIPDMEIFTEGRDFCDAIEMARDAIGLKALDYEDRKADYPAASDPEKAKALAKAASDEDFDFSEGTMTFVDVDTVAYKNKVRKLSVKKNCTIPAWLNDKAEAQGINFSRVLQEALIGIVGTD